MVLGYAERTVLVHTTRYRKLISKKIKDLKPMPRGMLFAESWPRPVPLGRAFPISGHTPNNQEK
jgi:hypothetical protein